MRLLVRADARRIPLRAASVHCCVTSPPYWGLRDYGTTGQLGLERTPEEYVANMVAVFREVRRVLRDDGTLWLNLGDTYYNSDKWGGGGVNTGKHTKAPDGTVPSWSAVRRRWADVPGIKPKDLVGIPWHVAFALQADGWYLRSDIIWSKPNPMPESVRDRPTKAHEYLFLLSKSERYFYDAEAIKEPATYAGEQMGVCRGTKRRATANGHNPSGNERPGADADIPAGRNRRTVWTVATQPYSGAHFATFPEKLVEPCILAGTSAKGCCPLCGAPWERVVEREREDSDREPRGKATTSPRNDGNAWNENGGRGFMPIEIVTAGWTPACDHGKEPVPCRVLDPFAGTATTVRVANRLGRKGVGLDISAAYLTEQAQKRTSNVQMEIQ
jgi:DNA modification methylase